jgi:type I restriction enzyme M protein
MAIKKSELYSSIWAMCDELRGGMDASQYKDYVLVMLFIKYISDKYAGVPYAPITVPEGASFNDMVALKGKDTIGDDINKKIIEPIANANKSLGNIDVDFNNNERLGNGPEMVKRLSNLIAIFQNPDLNFGRNNAGGDDILGDAYEYLMRHFATESGKSKGQFYTPSEVSRVMAKIIGINSDNTSAETTIYDPTCGSGSLLLKVADEAEKTVSIYGQEKDVSTAALSRMNMVLHNYPTALIKCNGNSTLSDPLFKNESGSLKTFDFVVANPPFSYKAWSSGVDPVNDVYHRFQHFGIPPEKNGDYAFLLHILRSLKSKGKGAVILPHGVLFRGNSEAEIRENLIKPGYIKGIIGLPPNLFYGTGIPACIIVLDKENAAERKHVFMIDAGKGFLKDGNKNRLREQDIHKIVDTFNRELEIDKYSRNVPIDEIESKEYNLNIPRYIDSQEPEDIQDIDAHLNGGIPDADIDALQKYWNVYPTMKEALFGNHLRKNYSLLKIEKDEIKNTIFNYPEFITFSKKIDSIFSEWKNKNVPILKNLDTGAQPKKLIYELSEDLLQKFGNLSLIDKYDVYQHLMNYWNDTIQDDVYVIAGDGWETGGIVYRIEKQTKDKTGKTKTKEVEGIEGIESKLIPASFIINRYFLSEKEVIEKLQSECEAVTAEIQEMEEEHTGEEGLLNDAKKDKDKITIASVKEQLKKIKSKKDNVDEVKLLEAYLELADKNTAVEKTIKQLQKDLEQKVWNQYKQLTIDEIKSVVVDDKWIAALETAIATELQRVSQRLTQRIKELAERYETPLPEIDKEVEALEEKVKAHLQKMDFVWN